MPFFTFHDSFQDTLRKSDKKCSCGSTGDNPHRHDARCAVTALYAQWNADAAARWEKLRPVPTRASNEAARGQYFEEG